MTTLPRIPSLIVRLSRRHERWLYLVSTLLFGSGIGWLIAHYFFAGADGLPAPAEPWWLRLHGAMAMGFLIVFGSLLPGHIYRAWKARRNFASGVTLLSVSLALILSGYALYYASSEDSRPWISAIHWVIGLAAALALPVHVVLGRRKRHHHGKD